MSKLVTREEWLLSISKLFVLPRIKKAGGKTDYKYRVSVGFPKGRRGTRAKTIGQCWDPTVSADGTAEIFISPELDAYAAVATLVHEHVHASVGLKAGHKGEFRKLGIAIGLTGKMASSTESEELAADIKRIIIKVGDYPHAILTPSSTTAVQTTRMLKCSCEACGYTVRTSAKWLAVSVPVCPDPTCDDYQGRMLVGIDLAV